VANGPILQVFIGPSREMISTFGAATVAPAVPVSALVDTGAQSTVLNPETVARLGLRSVGVVTIHTPTTTEPVMCRQFHINVYFTHEFAIENVLAIEAPFSGRPFQCLIGRDILNRAKLVYDGRANNFCLSF
jgi:predicted aspartyl protease